MKQKLVLVLLVLTALACKAQAPTPPSSPTQIRAAIKPAQIIQAPTLTCTVTALEALNLREGPGTDSEVIAVLAHGELVTILDKKPQGNWIHVRATRHIGWINSTYCTQEK